MNIEKYQKYFTADLLMGPNSIRLLENMLEKYPIPTAKDSVILDLGCGKGLTSYVISCETGAKVYATDLWVTEEENRARFEAWGKSEVIIPVNRDANDLQYPREFFDAMISIDSYHYFAGKPQFFIEKILPLIKPGGIVLIAVPGIKEAYEADAETLLADWAGNESYMFHSPTWWKGIIGTHEDIATVETRELDCFANAWEDWLKTSNQYAQSDLQHYETIIKPYTNFVGIMVHKK